MVDDTFLINLYSKVKDLSKSDFDRFINNVEMQYDDLDKSLDNIEYYIQDSKWSDDVRDNLNTGFDNMKTLKEKCRNYATNVIVPLSSEFEILQSKLKEYFENVTTETDDLTYIDSLFDLVNNNIDMIFDNPQSIQSLFDSFYANNSNINRTYFDMAKDSLQSSVEFKSNVINIIQNSDNNSYYESDIDRSFKLHTIERVKEKVTNYIKEDKLKESTSNTGKESIKEECYNRINRINELLKYGVISTPVISRNKVTTVTKTIENNDLKETVKEKVVIKETNDNVETVTDVLGASAIASAAAVLDASGKIDTVLDDDIGAVKRTVTNTEEDVSDEQKEEKKEGSYIHFINVTESDAILIESNNRYGLIDASGSNQVNTVLSYLRSNNVKHLDFIIASHHHWDHVSGMPDVINSELVDNTTTLIYKKGVKDDSANGEVAFNIAKDLRYTDIAPGVDSLTYLNNMLNAMNSKSGILLETTTHSLDRMEKLGAKYVSTGNMWKDHINFQFEKLTIDIYNLPIYMFEDNGKKYYSDNSNSLVTLITTPNAQRILLSGDLDLRDDYENFYADLFGKIDVVKANHHGYTYSNSFSYISKVKPTYFIIPNSKAAAQEHINALYLYLKKIGTRVYFAHDGAINGAVKVRCEGPLRIIGTEAVFTPKEGWVPWSNYSNNPKALWKKYVYIKDSEFLKGWQKLAWENIENWYYFDSNGFCVTGWHKLTWNNKEGWYFFGEKPDNKNQGVMYSNTWEEVDGKWYRLGNDGAMITSDWVLDKGKYYHVDEEGAMQSNCWIKENNKEYYLGKDGAMLANTSEAIGGKRYKFDASGVATPI